MKALLLIFTMSFMNFSFSQSCEEKMEEQIKTAQAEEDKKVQLSNFSFQNDGDGIFYVDYTVTVDKNDPNSLTHTVEAEVSVDHECNITGHSILSTDY